MKRTVLAVVLTFTAISMAALGSSSCSPSKERQKIDTIASFDRDFDRFPGISRREP